MNVLAWLVNLVHVFNLWQHYIMQSGYSYSLIFRINYIYACICITLLSRRIKRLICSRYMYHVHVYWIRSFSIQYIPRVNQKILMNFVQTTFIELILIQLLLYSLNLLHLNKILLVTLLHGKSKFMDISWFRNFWLISFML